MVRDLLAYITQQLRDSHLWLHRIQAPQTFLLSSVSPAFLGAAVFCADFILEKTLLIQFGRCPKVNLGLNGFGTSLPGFTRLTIL